MTKIGYKGEIYICTDEKVLEQELRKEGLEPDRFIKESWEPETIKIVVNGVLWSINGYVLEKIFDRIPSLFKKK